MSTTILHCGLDDCSRLAVLAHRGFQIHECADTPEQLKRELQERPDIKAVVFSENSIHPVDLLVPIARTQLSAPVILFADIESSCNPALYDLVIAAGTPPVDWLEHIEKVLQASAQLRADSRKIHKHSAVLRATSAAAREESRETRHRAADLQRESHKWVSPRDQEKAGD